MPVSGGDYPLIRLVQDSFPTVSVVVAKLASEKINRGLGQLGGYLCSFAEEIVHLSNDQKRSLERDGKIIRALEELEKAISWYDGPSTKHGYPSLHAVAAAQRMADEGNQEGLKSLSAIAAKIRASLIKKRVKPDVLVVMIQKCSDIQADDYLNETDLSTIATDDLPGYDRHARTVHSILCSYAACSCRKSLEPDYHWARLRLKPVYELLRGDLVPFEMLFSTSPNPSQGCTYEWQGIQVLNPCKSKLSKRVQFDAVGSGDGYQTQSGGIDAEPVQGSLCGFISNTYGSILCFKVDGNRLIALQEAEDVPTGRQVRSNPGLHLGEILGEFKMRYGMRPVLAYILAKAVWHYYDSDWMNVGWKNDNICFMSETGNDAESIYFLRPYLCAQLDMSRKNPPEYRTDVGMMHKYPRVLALGMMLTEIAAGRPVSIEGNPDDWNARTANERLLALKSMLKGANIEEDCRFPRYKTAVEKCLDPKLFKNAPFNPSKPRENLEKRRSILYDEVVDPLRQLIEGTGWHAEFNEIERTPLVPKKHSKPVVARPDMVLPTVERSQLPHAAASDAKWRRDAWLERIALINQKIWNDSKAAGRTSRLKIAILDTGYDDDAPSFYIPGRLSRLKSWKDFVSASPKPVDSDGHGTHLVTLLLQVAPSAEIFVARVAENSAGLTAAEDSISQAIRVAAMEWDVDFVSLSFGFSRHMAKIRDAIFDAVYHKKGAITFFAAAANDGFNSREMFPANLGESVISIRGTNRSGAFEPDFNPPTSSQEPVFGTLGKDVYSDWIGDEGRRSMSGCSVATPVAVGIASILLEYAASRAAEFQPSDLRLMRTRRGIFELFKEIGIHAGEGRYYVAPFELFSMSEDTRIAKMKAAIGRHPERW